MNSSDYLKWAVTKNCTEQQYKELGTRLSEATDKLKLIHAVLGIAGETGELTEIVKKHIMYDKPLDLDNIKEEVSDVLWYMAILLDNIGSSFEEVMQLNYNKLETRYPDGFTENLAIERRDKNE